MRVLFISRHFPDNLRVKVHGVYKRMAMFIDAIKNIANLDMLFYVPPDTDVSHSHVSSLQDSFSKHWDADIRLFLFPRAGGRYNGRLERWWSYGTGVFNFHKQRIFSELSQPEQIKAFEQCLDYKPDAVFAHRLFSMSPLMLTKKPLPPVFLDLDDIEHILFKRMIAQGKGFKQKYFYLFLPALRRGEFRAIKKTTMTFVCSEHDRSYLKNRWQTENITTIPNAIAIPELYPITSKRTMLFLGSDYVMNIDAAQFLIKDIWPSVLREIPEARLIIAGITPEKLNGNCHQFPGIEIPGFVDDLDQLYRESRVVCAPILAGGGTRVKIIEAAAYGKPVVSTRIGAEGIQMQDGEDLLLHDDPQLFAQACVRLLKDTVLCERLGTAARLKATRYYDRNKIIRLIQNSMTDCIT